MDRRYPRPGMTDLQCSAYDRIVQNMHVDIESQFKSKVRPEPFTPEDGNAVWDEWCHLETIFGTKRNFMANYYIPAMKHINDFYHLTNDHVPLLDSTN